MNVAARLQRLALLILAISVGLCGLYWWQLTQSFQQIHEDVIRRTGHHAEQVAKAVAQHMTTLVRGIDFALRELRDKYDDGDMGELEQTKRLLLDSFPVGSIEHIGMIGSDGYLVWPNLGPGKSPYLGDRETVREHFTSGGDRLFISKPVLDRVSKRWVVQFSRPVVQGGRVIGVMLIALRPDYLAQNLASLSINPNDSISLIRADGAFLARSANVTQVMGKSAPADSPFLGQAAPSHGSYESRGTSEPIQRLYGWYRADEFPLIVSFGVAKARVIAPLEEMFAHSDIRNGLGTAFVLLLSGAAALLLFGLAREHVHLASNEARLNAVLDSASDAIAVTDDGNRIIRVNPAFTAITGYRPEDVIGKNPSLLASGEHGPEFYRAMWNSLARKNHWEGEIRNRRRDGRAYVEWLRIGVIRDRRGVAQNYVAVFSDVTDRKRKEDAMWRHANFDVLTGLPNRLMFEDHLKLAIAQAGRGQTSLALLFIDLDHFKPVNDELGHAAGDELLQQVARRLKSALREEDTVARIGGDEFVVILPELRMEDAHERTAEKIVTTLREPFQLGSHVVEISCSVGIALFPRDGYSVEALVAKADAAMYCAKDAGRATWRA